MVIAAQVGFLDPGGVDHAGLQILRVIEAEGMAELVGGDIGQVDIALACGV